MSALRFIDCYDAVRGFHFANEEARKCVEALKRIDELPIEEEIATLRKLKKHLNDDHKTTPLGALVVAVLKARLPAVIATSAALLAPKMWPEREAREKAKRRALQLHADSYLVLAWWIAEWNRRQIRRVA